MLTVTVEGAETLAARLEALPVAVQASLAAKSAALADQLLALVRRKLSGGVLQSRTGALLASIAVTGPLIQGDRIVVSVSSMADLKYAAIQEYGGVTSPHDILPRRAKALAFLTADGETFARIVHHPGSHIPERSYLRSSLEEMAPVIQSELRAAVREALGADVGS
jgi:phage gpG-like protein